MRNRLRLTICVDATAAGPAPRLPCVVENQQREFKPSCQLSLFQETIENGGTCFEFGQDSKSLPVSSPMAKSVSFHSGTSLPEERKISSG